MTDPAEALSVTPHVATDSGRLASSAWTAITFALAGSLLAWWLIQTLHPVFAVPDELAMLLAGYDPLTPEQFAEWEAARLEVSLYNSLLVLGWSGALLAGALALGEGWARRSWKMALGGCLICTLVGPVFGCLAGWTGHSVYQDLRLQNPQAIGLKGATMVQMAMMAALGAGVGLATGSLTRRISGTLSCLLGGAIAGASAGLVYPITVAFFLPRAQTEHIIPKGSLNALIWLGLIGVLLGLILPGMTARRKPFP